MRYILLAIGICLSIFVSAQFKNPLDTIPQPKREMLVEFSTHISADVIAELTIKIFNDRYKPEFIEDSVLLIPSPDKKSIIRVSIDVVPMLNKSEFANYILASYSKWLTVTELKEMNRVYRLDIGKKAETFTRNILLNFDYTDSSYNSLEFRDNIAPGVFDKYKIAFDAVYEEMLDLLFKYIDEKDRSLIQEELD